MTHSNADQQEFWSHVAGPQWLAHQASMDALMQPVLVGVFDRAGLAAGQRVLDIGCGTGASTVQAAQRVGAGGQVLGADISAPLLDLARTRAAGLAPVSFVHADAADHAFDAAAFDHLISRFGVMFFGAPETAFANMARALRGGGGEVTFACWGQIPENPFFKRASKAARDVLGPMPRPDLDAPGPFAFRDPDRISAILSAAGLKDIDIDVAGLMLTPPDDLDAFADLACAIGPCEAAITYFKADADQIRAVKAAVIAEFTEYQSADGLRIPAQINFVRARRAS